MLKTKEVMQMMNQTASTMFKKSIDISFGYKENTNQIKLNVPSASNLSYLNGRMIKKTKSKEIIDTIKVNPNYSKCSLVIINLLKELIINEMDLNRLLDIRIDVSKDVLDKAKELLREHINDVKEFYINPVVEMIDSINDDSITINKSSINKVWVKHVLPKYNVIDRIDSFKDYFEIKEYNNYPLLDLKCKTATISLAENTTKNFLKIVNNEKELEKVKQTERILSKCYKYIVPFIEVEWIIEKNEMSNYVVDNKKYSMINYKNFYRNQIDKRLKVDFISGELKIDSQIYNLLDVDLVKIEELINNIYLESIEKTKEYINDEIQKRKDRFNQPYIYDILNVINDFPKKGITTYTSILVGENSSKIKSNDYDKSLSYGKMSEFTNSYITNKIRDCIDQGFIEENRYKASFGRYIGLTLSDESKDYINNFSLDNNILNNDVEKEEIKCFNTLLNRLRASSSSKAKILLMKTSEASIPFIKSDFDILLNFIENNRNIYREYEDIFNQCISKIVPIKYKPLFLLNSNFASGVNKKTLKSIYEHMEKIEEKL